MDRTFRDAERAEQSRRSSDRTSRRGISIVEVLLALSALSALSVLTITVVCLLTSAEQHAAESLFVDLTVASLAADLREDAHQALGVEAAPPDDEGRVLQVTFHQPGDRKVTYQCTSDSVVRRQEDHRDAVATETYRLALGESRFEIADESELLMWTHEREIPNLGGFAESGTTDGPLRTYHVHAAVGLRSAGRKEAK